MMVVLVTLFHGWVACASIGSTSHDAVGWSMHDVAPLSAQIDDHGHSHDEPGTDDQDAGHQHGHNPADHSHDKLDLPRLGADVAAASIDVLNAVSQVPAHPGPYFPFERPPKVIPIL